MPNTTDPDAITVDTPHNAITVDTPHTLTLRTAQIRALQAALGDRVQLTSTGAILVDGQDVTDVIDDEAATHEYDHDASDIVTRVLICLGENPGAPRTDDN